MPARWVTVAAVTALLFPTLGRADALSTVNASFEQGDETPTGWSFNHRGTAGEIAWDRSRARAGDACVRITNHAKGQTGNVYQTIRMDPPLQPGSRVMFSAYSAADDADAAPRIILNLYSTSGLRQDASASGAPGTHDFGEVRGEAVAELPSNRIVIYLCNYAVGSTWWDDVTVTVEPAEPTRIVPRPEAGGSLLSLGTDDRLGLALNANGAVGRLSLDGRNVPGVAANTGLWVTPFGGDITPVMGKLAREDGALVQRFVDEQLGLTVEARLVPDGEAIRCTGVVEDLTGRDRALDVLFSVPIGGEGWRWGQSIREEAPLSGGPHALQTTTFSSVSDPTTGDGVALAVPADSPCDCDFAYGDEFGYTVRFRFGLSPAAGGNLKSRAPFSFVLYRCDGRWGLRDAARRYYGLYPEAFAKRVTREGLWMFGVPRFEVPDPQNYAFHEAGADVWEYDDKHGIATCPYIIPGQREITRLPSLPAGKEEAMDILRDFQPADAGRRGASWGGEMKAIIESCMLHDAGGRPQVRIRNTPWGGNSVTFPLNASPLLFGETERSTIATALLADVERMHEEIPSLDGIYVDSLGAWGDYLNHRREHFAYAQVPLTYDPGSGRPVLHNRFALLEFLWGLGDYLHERGKLLFANGVHPDRRFHFFALDVMGVEGHGALEQKRVMAYRKPFLLLVYNIHTDPGEMEHYYKLCTFYGIYPSFANMRVYETPEMYAPVAALNQRYVPLLRAITAAGWRPITHARSSDEDIWLERWGPGEDAAVYLTVYNSAGEMRRARLSVDARQLGVTGAVLMLEDALLDDTWRAAVRDGMAGVEVRVPGETVRVLRVRGE